MTDFILTVDYGVRLDVMYCTTGEHLKNVIGLQIVSTLETQVIVQIAVISAQMSSFSLEKYRKNDFLKN